MQYLTEQRIASLKQYLADCNSGMSYQAAWSAHKARMENEAHRINESWSLDLTNHGEKQFFFGIMCEPSEYKEIAATQWLELVNA